MKVSIIMPTYNDSQSITKSIESVIYQDYTNLELIIVDDGSSDESEKVIKSFKDERIKYLYQDNADQLNAVINGFNISSGDIIYILHSDDLFHDHMTVSKVVNKMLHSNYDAIKGDLIIIDELDKVTGSVKVRDYSEKNTVLTRMLLLYGMNILNDFAFIRRNAFIKYSYQNYLLWNTPFWINFADSSFEMIKMSKVEFPILKYRVHKDNYINNKIGKFNVVNGNLRTLMYLLNSYSIPFFTIQRLLTRLFKDRYRPVYIAKPTVNKYKVIKKAIKFRVGEEYKDNIYLVSLLNFHKNKKNKSITIQSEVRQSDVYYGKDMREFNKAISQGKLPPIYIEIFEKMSLGFSILEIEKEREAMIKDILTFLNIIKDVEIYVK